MAVAAVLISDGGTIQGQRRRRNDTIDEAPRLSDHNMARPCSIYHRTEAPAAQIMILYCDDSVIATSRAKNKITKRSGYVFLKTPAVVYLI